ncbi:uncharacterized protein LOC103569155 [Trichonephila clavipes]|uniref:Uncharacterized protein LOC103569155, partial n=1 Tax=Trichonephila clavipes TaxID=2585209 RepID=A0A8X6WJH6_TRICX|nr:uncharacterized protein LOC103569155 [Trichonephila clavipes]
MPAVDVLVLPKITCDLTQFQVDASTLNTFMHLKLAGVNCLQPGPKEILLDADVFGEIMLNRHLNVQGQSLTAMESIFGRVVLGKTKLSCQRMISNHASYNAVEFQLDKFWQLEELGEKKPFTNEEIACENNFKRTHTRDSTGRFVVNFPFRDSSEELGSLDIKIPRFLFFDSDNQFHLFGFSDASEKAYAATIYCRYISDTRKNNVQQ